MEENRCPHDELLREMFGDVKVIVQRVTELEKRAAEANGHVEELQRRYNASQVLVKVDTAATEAIRATVLTASKLIVATIALASTVVPTVFVVVSRL